jgi:hypothetical protein
MNKLLLSLICVTSLAASIPSFASAPKPAATAQSCIKNLYSTQQQNNADGTTRWHITYENGCSRNVKVTFVGGSCSVYQNYGTTFTSAVLRPAPTFKEDLSCKFSWSTPALGKELQVSYAN